MKVVVIDALNMENIKVFICTAALEVITLLPDW
jgi:hypothetical protein